MHLDHVVVGPADDQPAVVLDAPYRRNVADQHMQAFPSLGKSSTLANLGLQ